jgi:hypothetical protein
MPGLIAKVEPFLGSLPSKGVDFGERRAGEEPWEPGDPGEAL